jgi:hypothetical protein
MPQFENILTCINSIYCIVVSLFVGLGAFSLFLSFNLMTLECGNPLPTSAALICIFLSIIQLMKQHHVEGRINLQRGLQLVLPFPGDEFYYILGSIIEFESSILF